MTTTVTVQNPVGNQATANAQFLQSPTATCPTIYKVASGETRTFAVYPGASLYITETPWENKKVES